MQSFKVVIAYDGTDLVGWQRQAAGVSIQGLLEDALRALDERDVTVVGAGRTDAGVHALGQVAAFTLARPLPPESILRALNARLPDAVRVLSAEHAAASFNPRFDARSKTYRYRILNGPVKDPFERRYAWHIAGTLDIAAMDAAARLLEGPHDFAAFRSSGTEVKSTERQILTSRIADCGLRIYCGFEDFHDQSAITNQSAILNPQSAMRLLVYTVEGTGFLRHMVRAIVGSLVEIGLGRREPAWITQLLASRDRAAAGPTAPAEGLFLVRVQYGDAVAAER
jgi:tRNA pseudouridine38-40 synthase